MIFSLGLAAAAALMWVTIAASLPAYRNQGLLGAGIGIFTFAVIWPGLVTTCLIFADGFYTYGFSRSIFVRAALWGLVPPVFIGGLLKAGISWVMLPDAIFGESLIGMMFGFVFLLSPSFLCAYIGRRSA